MIVAVIPARGGSKRIPRKNIRPFAGKPIIAYSIAAAQQCRLFDRIVVSTDDAEIAAVARSYGAETPFVRPAELSDEHTGTVAVTGHALTWLGGVYIESQRQVRRDLQYSPGLQADFQNIYGFSINDSLIGPGAMPGVTYANDLAYSDNALYAITDDGDIYRIMKQ